jgi:CheY-like chemotaxis protein
VESVVKKPVVALIQSNPDVAHEISAALENQGFLVATYVPGDFLLRHKRELIEFLRFNHAEALIYDIATPYFENWEAFEEIRSESGLQDQPYLLTTIDKNLLQNVTSVAPYFEIRGSQFDRNLFSTTFKKIWDAHGHVGLKRRSFFGLGELPKENVSQ